MNGNVVQITPQIAGTVVGIAADDTQFVNAGQTLVQLDAADMKIALEQADAKLAKTVRDVRGLFATTAQLKANVDLHDADVARATEDLSRRERLASSGAVSGEELQHARDALSSAKASLDAARQELAANQARVDRTTVANHPDVLARQRRFTTRISTSRARSFPRPCPATSPNAPCSSASAWRQARR